MMRLQSRERRGPEFQDLAKRLRQSEPLCHNEAMDRATGPLFVIFKTSVFDLHTSISRNHFKYGLITEMIIDEVI